MEYPFQYLGLPTIDGHQLAVISTPIAIRLPFQLSIQSSMLVGPQVLSIVKKLLIYTLDCEGFVGSDSPISQEIVTALSEPNWLFRFTFGEDCAEQRVLRHWQAKQDMLLRKVNQFLDGAESRIDVEWGKLDYPDPRTSFSMGDSNERRLYTVQHKTRKLIVEHLYPRVLYGFSDVVCFVTTNGRFVQTTGIISNCVLIITELLRVSWANSSIGLKNRTTEFSTSGQSQPLL